MKLADLLADTSTEELERLAHEHARADEQMARPQLLATLESTLRSHRFLHDFLVNRQPPTFAALTLLLDAEGYALPTANFKQLVMEETARLCHAFDEEGLLARNDELRIYRRVLHQARSNDGLIDDSEAAILGVLRQELDITQVEHFLLEHHSDFRAFWSQDGGFLRELGALRSAGLVFVREGMTLIPEDLGRPLRQVLGIDMPRSAARRLLERLTGAELVEALERTGIPTSGRKDEKIERLILHMVQPRAVLSGMSLVRRRELCREVNARVAGSTDELLERIVAQVAAGRDLVEEPESPPPPIEEPRELEELRFKALFAHLRWLELGAILGDFELRQWGNKDVQLTTLWDSHRSEETLLSRLTLADLERLLKRLGLASGGSKAERIRRAIAYLQSIETGDLVGQVDESTDL